MADIRTLIRHFQLQPHPEGGWYASTYVSGDMIPRSGLPPRFGGDRPISTAILFLLEQGNFSAFHRIRSDECWHFYHGDPLKIFILHPEEGLQVVRLGANWEQGELFQFVVPAGCWFASRPAEGSRYSLVGCTVAPGFDFADFEMAAVSRLTTDYPQYRELIRELCRP